MTGDVLIHMKLNIAAIAGEFSIYYRFYNNFFYIN